MVTQKQKGATLIEVLISMLMLGLGVLVLLATQLKTVSGVREAENQTIVAQATQNLIEGMLMNPTLEERTLNRQSDDMVGVRWNRKQYEIYRNNINDVNPSSCTPLNTGNDINKTQLALQQMCNFRQTLANNLPDAEFQIHICRDNSDGEPVVANGNITWNCAEAASVPTYTVVKVVWQMDTENQAAQSGGGVNVVNGRAVYTYQARVTD
ncbi:type IV pilus modification protein PilV [Neisseria wadsworthii]|uniref:type IV pilus modification protein PilV n=1 Tax=Neisseria wadsworthii TaxID=607711 RepID=UPI000D307735|nr:type IV pilus modification protein PilV [Neisseria wadsworthii]